MGGTSISSSSGGFVARIKRAVGELKGKDGSRSSLYIDGQGRLHVVDKASDTILGAIKNGKFSVSLDNVRGIIPASISNFPTSQKVQTKVVYCPVTPIEIPGITAADALDANDCIGTLFTIEVPPSGVIYSATYWDLDDEGTQLDLEIFKHEITQIASDAAWNPSDVDMLSFVTELAFVAFDDHISSQTSELTNIGKAYMAPEGKLWIQAVDRSTKNIATGQMPRVQLQILSDDPNWQER